MAKNNWLMVSYILFLLLCAFVRSFMDYPMWDTIVIAVTISGGFLTYSESYESTYNYLKQNNDEVEKWFEKFLDVNRKEVKTCKEVIDCIKESKIESDYYNGLTHKFNDLANDLNGLFNQEERSVIQKQRKHEKIYCCASIAFSIMGFLMFFCIITFPQVKCFFENSQSIYTVLAFAVMLSSQLLKSYRDNKIASYRKEIQEKYEEFESQMEEIASLKDDVLSGLRLEASTNAD